MAVLDAPHSQSYSCIKYARCLCALSFVLAMQAVLSTASLHKAIKTHEEAVSAEQALPFGVKGTPSNCAITPPQANKTRCCPVTGGVPCNTEMDCCPPLSTCGAGNSCKIGNQTQMPRYSGCSAGVAHANVLGNVSLPCGVAYYSNGYSLTNPENAIELIIISIPDDMENPSDSVCALSALLKNNPNYSNKTVSIFVPYFLDVDNNNPEAPPDGPLLAWDRSNNAGTWWGGWNSSLNVPSCRGARAVSSFEVLDRFVSAALDQHIFPKLKNLAFFGHGYGAQMIQSYALVSPLLKTVEGNQGLLRFALANANSYTYLDNTRFNEKSQKFQVPNQNTCENYNQWSYGWDKSFPHYVDIALKTTPRQELARLYSELPVTYLLGAMDTCANKSSCPAPTCSDLYEGSNRLTRGQLFGKYMSEAHNSKSQSAVVVPNVGHDGILMVQSAQAATVLFGEAPSPSPPSPSPSPPPPSPSPPPPSPSPPPPHPNPSPPSPSPPTPSPSPSPPSHAHKAAVLDSMWAIGTASVVFLLIVIFFGRAAAGAKSANSEDKSTKKDPIYSGF
eukprot:m.52351 g.52351  ORF g.52351 m.52351 type:complete len:560 (+) comp10786_c3_seq2:275-1954(+)